MFILFIMYIWPSQLPPRALAGEPFSISHFGSERSLGSSFILLSECRSTFAPNNALTAGLWHILNVKLVVNDR